MRKLICLLVIFFTLPVFAEDKPTKQKGTEPYKDPITSMELVPIKGGCFQMGNIVGNGYHNNEKPVHEVCVSDYYSGKFDVTKGAFKKFIENTGYRTNAEKFGGCQVFDGKIKQNTSATWRSPGFSQDDDHPVVCVSRDDSIAFAEWLSDKSGRTYRLPTEAEWEYAARSGGKNEKYAGGDDIDILAWYGKNSGNSTHPVGQKKGNGLGLYDMSGNVSQWTADRYDENYYRVSPKDNPEGPLSGPNFVYRGGDWHDIPTSTRTSTRKYHRPDFRSTFLGFRLVSPVTNEAEEPPVYSAKPIIASPDEITSPSWWRQRAIQDAPFIIKKKHRDKAYIEIARASGWNGDFVTANLCLTKISNPKDKLSAYQFIVHDCHKAGNSSCYETNMQQVRLLSIQTGVASYSLISDYLKYNDIKGAISFAEEAIPAKQERASAYRQIIIHLMKEGKFNEAEALFKSQIPEYMHDRVLNEMALAAADYDTAKSKEIAGRITLSKEKDDAYTGIGIVQAKKANFQGAWEIAEQLHESEQKSAVIYAIAEKQIEAGALADAEETAKRITDRDRKLFTLYPIAEAQIRAGLIDAALVRIKEMEKLIEKSQAPADKSKFGVFDDTAKMAKVRALHSGIAGQLAKRGDMIGYREHIKIAQDAARNIKPEAGIMQPFIIIPLVTTQLDAGDIAGAKTTAAMIEIDGNTRSMVLGDIVRKQLGKGDTDGAIATANGIVDKRYTYGAISGKLVESGKLVQAKELLATFDGSKWEYAAYSMYGQATSSLAKMNRQLELIQWVNMLTTPEARVYAYIGAAQGFDKTAKSQKQSHPDGQ